MLLSFQNCGSLSSDPSQEDSIETKDIINPTTSNSGSSNSVISGSFNSNSIIPQQSGSPHKLTSIISSLLSQRQVGAPTMNSNATALLWKHSKNDEVTNPTTAKDALSETTTESNKDQGN